MHIGLFHAWLLALPMVITFGYVAVFHRDAAKRMGDMIGYTGKEKLAAVSASLSPYPFMLMAVFTPFTPNRTALVLGAMVYVIGLVGFVLSVTSYTKTAPHEPATNGIYRISRNPIYVSALLMFAGIACMTLNIFLAMLLILMIPLHHQMILAEERACANSFGPAYDRYRVRTPRYLIK